MKNGMLIALVVFAVFEIAFFVLVAHVDREVAAIVGGCCAGI